MYQYAKCYSDLHSIQRLQVYYKEVYGHFQYHLINRKCCNKSRVHESTFSSSARLVCENWQTYSSFVFHIPRQLAQYCWNFHLEDFTNKSFNLIGFFIKTIKPRQLSYLWTPATVQQRNNFNKLAQNTITPSSIRGLVTQLSVASLVVDLNKIN